MIWNLRSKSERIALTAKPFPPSFGRQRNSFGLNGNDGKQIVIRRQSLDALVNV